MRTSTALSAKTRKKVDIMTRPKQYRKVCCKPEYNYFKPIGVKKKNLKEINLTVDEYEALRLKDKEKLSQKEAAKRMDISQPTFYRMIKKAREKISEALINGKAIKIEGGRYKMPQRETKGIKNPPSECECPECGYSEKKERGVPCSDIKCSECGSRMIRGE